MTRIAKTVLCLIVAASFSTPAFAAKNTGKYKTSSEAQKQREVNCVYHKNMLEIAEREADARAGTKAAAKYSKEADAHWSAGVKNGCGWAH